MAAFLKTAGTSNITVFWSGFQDLTMLHTWISLQHRKSIETVLGTQWATFQKTKSGGGIWNTWAGCVKYFWNPVSQAFAEQATGEVYFVSTKTPASTTTWETVGKASSARW